MSASIFEGPRLRLAPVTGADLPNITQWYLDPEFSRMFAANPAPLHVQAHWEKWLEETQKDDQCYLFGLRIRADDRFIGWIILDSILWAQRNSWLAIAIADPTMRGQGYGHEGMSLVLDYAFNELNLHRVQLTVFSNNSAAIRLYKRLGFKHEGGHREFLRRDGHWLDMLQFGILESEWREIRARAKS